MAAATGLTGLQFGNTSTTSSLLGAKTTATTGSTFSFGSSTSTGFTGFGVNKTTATTGLSFGNSTTTTAATGGGLFGAAAKTTAAAGFSLLSAKPTTTATTLQFGVTPTSGFGGTATSGFGSAGFSLPSSTSAATTTLKQPENPKEASVPAELTSLVTDLESHIKSQKDIKDEISKISSEGLSKTREEITSLKQAVALIANRLQRDSVAVENLKLEVGQELKNAEIAHRMKDVSASLQHDFAAPMEYFQRLVYSFETRINCYRQEIEELETFLSSSSSLNEFTPQDLLHILKRLNESFIGLASELQQVHEAVKVIKEKYLRFRRVVYNDSTDPFTARRKLHETRRKVELIGPSPFPVVQGAGIMASVFKAETKVPAIGIATQLGFASAFAKPAGIGLTRSLSFGGTGKSSGFGSQGSSLSSGNTLFGKTPLGSTASLNLTGTSSATSPFTLQKPPSGKRGKLF